MWRTVVVSFLFSQILGDTTKKVCSYHDVAEYLNVSSNQERFLYTLPRRNWKERVEVELDFTLVSILSVQEKLQVATFYFFLLVVWTNDYISWDPGNFCNISSITLPTNLFWTPSIFIDERADEDKVTSSTFLYISSNGKISMFQSYQLTSSCNLDVRAFPFDEQKCKLTLASALLSDTDIFLKSTKSTNMANDTLRYYLTNGDWKVLDVQVLSEIDYWNEQNFTAIVYEISIKRRSILYVLVLILPTSVLFLLDIAISFTFATPGEKIAFKLTLILQVSFLSMILTDKLPATSDDVPVIGEFFTGMFMFMILGILENALILYLKEKKPVLPCFKGKNFMDRFVRKQKKSENPEINLRDELSKPYDQTAEVPDSEKDHNARLLFLRRLNTDLEQIKKHLGLEEYQDTSESVQQEKTLLFIENILCNVRLILSIFFLGYIVIKWIHHT